jgi:AcrR family transcriptional regulator
MTHDHRTSLRGSAARRSRLSPQGRACQGPTLQQQQKENSHQRILQAAKEVLAETPYASMAVEDVIARANISRATFYKHFDSKFAIGRELHAEFAPRLQALYDRLLDYVDPTEAQLVDWVGRLVEFYRQERELIVTFSHMLAIEPGFHPIMINIIRETEERWAQRMPAFRLPASEGPAAMRARIESRLLLRQFNDFCYEVAIFDWKIDIAEGCRVMAGHFRDFLERYGRVISA